LEGRQKELEERIQRLKGCDADYIETLREKNINLNQRLEQMRQELERIAKLHSSRCTPHGISPKR